jgi:carbohydrate binding protein with CBM4/9 domain
MRSAFSNRLLTPIHLVIATLLVCAAAVPASAGGFPKLGLYGCIRGNGYPFLIGSTEGPYDPAAFDAVARFDMVTLNASPIADYRPDIIGQLRTRNPEIRVLAYVLPSSTWEAQNPDSTVHYPTRYRNMIRRMDGFLYSRSGQTAGAINLPKKNGQGRFVVVDSIAALFQDVVIRTGIWDGLFGDGLCSSIGWTQSPGGDSIDYVRAGYPTWNAFDSAWAAAVDSLSAILRRLGGPDFILVGNCGPGTQYASFNGWTRENFPWQIGGNWIENMYRDPGGYFLDDQRFRPPPHNLIVSSVSDPSTPYSAVNMRKMRFGLGSATLAEGYGTFVLPNLDCMSWPYHEWWYDEYAVDLTTGRSSTSGVHTGWLGQALGPHYQMIWVGSGPDAVSNDDFETDVTSGWSFAFAVPASVTRDDNTAKRGVASARTRVSQSNSIASDVQCSTVGRLPMTTGQNYSATFWAKASQPRRITVCLGSPAVGVLTWREIEITVEWRQYQVVLVPGRSENGGLQFFLGAAAGDVWLDDVHLQAGTSSLYRRDFQNGIVLVNPDAGSRTVPLERQFRKLLGNHDTAVNNGAAITQATVPGNDALFLIGSDVVAPAGITDLHPAKLPR